MNKNFSFTLKTLPIALASALTLTACDNAPTTVQNQEVQAPSIVRVASESLYADYAEMRAKQVSNVDYELNVNLDSKSKDFSGVTTIHFDLVENNQNDLTIDFDSGTVNKVKVNGSEINVSYEKWFITVPASALQPGKNSIEIDYQRPYSTDGSGLHRFEDPENGEVYLYTDFQPYNANKLFPHFDQPDLKASYTLTVNAPKQWKIISSTRENKIEEKGDFNTWYFPASAKFSSYVFAMHAGNFTVWEDTYQDVPLRLFARQSMAKYVKTEEWFPPTKQAFAFFNDYFDIKYPFVKYDQVIVPDYNAGAIGKCRRGYFQ